MFGIEADWLALNPDLNPIEHHCDGPEWRLQTSNIGVWPNKHSSEWAKTTTKNEEKKKSTDTLKNLVEILGWQT